MIKLFKYHHPPFVKHVLAPQNEFGMQKNTWSIYKSFGNWEDPPPPLWEKFPNNPVIFFWERTLSSVICQSYSFFICHPYPRLFPSQLDSCQHTSLQRWEKREMWRASPSKLTQRRTRRDCVTGEFSSWTTSPIPLLTGRPSPPSPRFGQIPASHSSQEEWYTCKTEMEISI